MLSRIVHFTSSMVLKIICVVKPCTSGGVGGWRWRVLGQLQQRHPSCNRRFAYVVRWFVRSFVRVRACAACTVSLRVRVLCVSLLCVRCVRCVLVLCVCVSPSFASLFYQIACSFSNRSSIIIITSSSSSSSSSSIWRIVGRCVVGVHNDAGAMFVWGLAPPAWSTLKQQQAGQQTRLALAGRFVFLLERLLTSTQYNGGPNKVMD